MLIDSKVIHVAGAKGKGTTCSYCNHILNEHLRLGFKRRLVVILPLICRTYVSVSWSITKKTRNLFFHFTSASSTMKFDQCRSWVFRIETYHLSPDIQVFSHCLHCIFSFPRKWMLWFSKRVLVEKMIRQISFYGQWQLASQLLALIMSRRLVTR